MFYFLFLKSENSHAPEANWGTALPDHFPTITLDLGDRRPATGDRRPAVTMIRAVIVMNTQGKPRLLKFYEFQPPEKQKELIRSVFAVLSGRPDNVSNFVEADAIFGPVFVETLDRCFKNVCELDIVFNFNKMHAIVDEIIFGGEVLETSSEQVMKAVEEISRLEKSSNSISFVPKAVSGRFGR